MWPSFFDQPCFGFFKIWSVAKIKYYGRAKVMVNSITLNENRDFRRLYRTGKSSVSSMFVLYAKKNRLGINRIGITSSKKVGNAVMRNRARRVLRAAYREIETCVDAGWDFVIVARSRTPACKSTDIAPVLKKQIETLTKRPKTK